MTTKRVYLTEAQTRVIRQTRIAVELLLDGAYRQLEHLPGGSIHATDTIINELLEHVREEVESRFISQEA